MITTRRSFLTLLAAPAIVSAINLMPVRSIERLLQPAVKRAGRWTLTGDTDGLGLTERGEIFIVAAAKLPRRVRVTYETDDGSTYSTSLEVGLQPRSLPFAEPAFDYEFQATMMAHEDALKPYEKLGWFRHDPVNIGWSVPDAIDRSRANAFFGKSEGLQKMMPYKV